MQNLEPPKPTEEFHKAYLEIYGKKRKEEKPAVLQTHIEPTKEKTGFDELEMLDIPPIKLSMPEQMNFPTLPKDVHKELFGTGSENKEFAAMDLPPPKKEAREKKPGLFAGLFKGKKQEKSADVGMLSEPPRKQEEAFSAIPSTQSLPALDKAEIETPRSELERVTKKETASAFESKLPELREKAIPRVHDFLAEIKYGTKKKTEIKIPEIKMPEMNAEELSWKIPEKEKFPTIIEQKESIFERAMSKKGARDMQIAFEKKHPHETGGFEYLEKIEPLKPLSIPKFKSAAEAKKYIKLVKAGEIVAKKQNADLKKKQNDLQQWIKKQRQQEEKMNEKMRKIQTMERELQEKQEAVSQYESQMQELYTRQDAILGKEREIKQRQQDTHETEVRIKSEENAIVAKIKRLETDQKILEKEQDAITRSVAKLDKERLQIHAKNREFTDILSKIGSAEKELKEKVQILDDREERIKKKERIIETEFARIQKLKKTAERLRDVEETYARMKDRLRIAYKDYEEKFSNQQASAPREIRAVPIQPTFQPIQPREAKIVDSGDITNLITATKQLIIDKHYDEANKNINRLMQRYMQIPDNNPRKKEIYYEIVGLKNMLKLDLLE
ncbi:MAG: hypothetical protein AABX98_06035 [Nanoarchaeota archaeon]